MATVVWPYGRLVPRDCMIDVAPRSALGPPSLSGFRQAVASDTAAWRITYSTIPVARRSDILLWRTLSAQIQGRVNAVLLPVYDIVRLKPGINAGTGGLIVEAEVPHSDGAEFGDTALYLQFLLSIAIGAPVVAGANTMTLSKSRSGTIEAGMHFSVGERLYRVTNVTSQTASSATVSVWPNARQAISAGAVAEFGRPVCKVRLMSDLGMDLTLNYGRAAAATVSFIEDPS